MVADMRDIVHRLSSQRGERDQSANKLLASEISAARNTGAVAELVELLNSRDKAVRTDAIQVLGEIASARPELLTAHVATIGSHLADAKGVLRWEGLTVLEGVSRVDPERVRPFANLAIVALDQDSVIARDKSVRVLVNLATGSNYESLMPTLLDVLRRAPVNQLPAYAEQICGIVRDPDSETVARILEDRLVTIDSTAKVRRIQQAIRSMLPKSRRS